MNYFLMPGLKERPVYKLITCSRDTTVDVICRYFGTTVAKLRVKNRDNTLVMIRHICFYYLHEKCGMSYKDIATYFYPAVSDHSTTLHGKKQIVNQLSLPHDNRIKNHIKNIGL